MKGDKDAENGGHAGGQMKGDKAAAAAKSSPEWRSCRGTDEGRQGARTKSRPEWRSRRETNEGRQGGRGSQEQARMETTLRMEIMQGDK